jgi:hypothetical protein
MASISEAPGDNNPALEPNVAKLSKRSIPTHVPKTPEELLAALDAWRISHSTVNHQ